MCKDLLTQIYFQNFFGKAIKSKVVCRDYGDQQ